MKRALITLFALTLAACSRADIDNKEAVRSAMIEYLRTTSASTGLDPNSMDVTVDAVAFERDLARATVSFNIKGTDQGMQMNYTLERDGDKWTNPKRQDQTAAPHGLPDGGFGDAPPLPPSTAPPGEGALPAGHPPVPGQAK